ncbi:MAG: site-2 protease family protein [Clostridia bacterium]|nr:site-2 protease family protein [Clostridia bacterium]
MDKIGERIGIIAMLISTLSLSASPHPVVLILCYLIHESGHIIMAKAVGAEMKSFKIGTLHLSISYDCSRLSYKRELLVLLGGIFFNLISALLAVILKIGGEACEFFVVGSISLALMNLYPISILDGGGVVKAIASMIWSGDVAEKISKITSFICAIVLWIIAVYFQIVFVSNFSLFLISVVLLVELCFTYM